ncbi:MAG: PASTA domain-containing protein [Anaerolineae bacterium]|nr:PASTA domain-containing protein [Anaerolineae bacterium]
MYRDSQTNSSPIVLTSLASLPLVTMREYTGMSVDEAVRRHQALGLPVRGVYVFGRRVFICMERTA